MLRMRVKISFEHVNVCQPRKRNSNKETSPNMGVNVRSQTRESSPCCNLRAGWWLGWAPGKELMSLRSGTWNCYSHNTVLRGMVCFFLVLAWSWWFPGVPAGLDPHMWIQHWTPRPKTHQKSIVKSGGKEKSHFPRFFYVLLLLLWGYQAKAFASRHLNTSSPSSPKGIRQTNIWKKRNTSIEFVVRNCHLGGLCLQCPLILGGWGK